MTNRVLLSMLAAAAMPAGAFADVDATDFEQLYNGANWTSVGTGANPSTVLDFRVGSLDVAYSSAAYLSLNTNDLAKGKYKFTNGGSNVKFTVKQGDTELAVSTVKNEVEFETEGGVVTIEMRSFDEGVAFTVANIKMQLEYDFVALHTALEAILSTATVATTIVDAPTSDDPSLNQSEEAKKLLAIYEEYFSLLLPGTKLGSYTSLMNDIDTYSSDEKKLNAYREWKLWSAPLDNATTLAEEIKIVLADYETRVAAENARWAIEKANKTSKATADAAINGTGGLIERINAVKTALNTAVVQKYDDASKTVVDDAANEGWAYQQYAAVIGILEGNIAAINLTIFDTDTEVVDPTEVNNKIATASAQILSELETPYPKTIAEVDGWNALQEYKKEVEDEYIEVNTYLEGLKPAAPAESAQVNAWIESLNGYKDTAYGTFDGTTLGTNADDNKLVNEGAKNAAIIEMTNLKTTAESKVSENEGAYAADLTALGGHETTFESLKGQVDVLKDTYKEDTDPEDPWPALTDKVTEIETDIAKLKATLADDDKEYKHVANDHDTEIAAIGTAVSDLQTMITTAQASALAYETAKSTIGEPEDSSTDPVTPATGWYKDLEDAKAAIQAEDVTTAYPILVKFQDTYNACKAAIDGLKAANKPSSPVDVSDPAVTSYITNGINEYQTKGVAAANAVKANADVLNTRKGRIDALETCISDRKTDIVDLTPAHNEIIATTMDCNIGTWEARLEGYKASYKYYKDMLDDIYNNNTDEALEVALGAYPTIPTFEVTGVTLANSHLTFAKELAQGNLKALDARIAEYEAGLYAVDAADKYGPALDKLKTQLAGYKTERNDINTALGSATAAEDYDAQDAPIVKLWTKVKLELDAAEAAAVANVANKKALDSKIDELKQAINDAYDDINATYPDPEYTEFKQNYLPDLKDLDPAAEPESVLEKTLDLDGNITTSYNNNEIDAAKLADYETQIQNLKDEVEAVKKHAADDLAAYTDLCDQAKDLDDPYIRGKINAALTDYAGAMDVEVTYTLNGTEITEKVIDAINRMRKLRLDLGYAPSTVLSVPQGVYKDIIDSYKAATIAADKAGFEDKLADIKGDIDEIFAGLAGGFYSSLLAHNEAQINALWQPQVDAYNAAFKTAVDTYEEIVDVDVEHADYKEVLITALLQDHAQRIYQYASAMQELKEQVEDIFNAAMYEGTVNAETGRYEVTVDANGDPVFKAKAETKELTDTDIAVQISSAKDIYDGNIIPYTNNLKNRANACAIAFYADALAAANAVVTEAEDVMNAAGISAEVQDAATADAKGWIASAKSKRTDALAEAAPALSLAMDDILDCFDKVAVDTEAAADAYWAAELAAAEATLATIESHFLDGDGNVYSFLSEEHAQMTTIKQQFDTEIKVLEATISHTAENYVKNLAYDLVQLLDKAADLDAIVLAKVANNTANIGYLADCKDRLNLDKVAYQDMWTQVSALDLKPEQFEQINTTAINPVITAIESLLENYDLLADFSENYATLEATFDLLEERINKAYADAYDAQLENAEALVHDAKYAFDIKVADSDMSDPAVVVAMNELNAKVNALEAEVAAAKLAAGDHTNLEYSEALTKLHDSEEKLEDLLVAEFGKTEANYDGVAQTAILASLTAAYEALSLQPIQDALNAAVTLTAGGSFSDGTEYADEIAAFTAKQAELQAEYEQIKADMEADNQLVLTNSLYTDRMTTLTSNVTSLAEAIAIREAEALAWNTTKANSDAKYAELKNQYDEYVAAIADLHKYIDEDCETLGSDFAQSQFEQIDVWMQTAINNLEAAKAGYSLTATSTLAWAYHIGEAIASITKNATKTETQNQIDAAKDKFNEALSEFNACGLDLANKAEIANELDVLYSTLSTFVATEVRDEASTVVGNAKAAKAEAEAIIAKIAENKVKRGDISGEGKISVLDYNMLLRIILTQWGTNYADLTDKKSMSCDVNRDGKINTADISSLINLLLEKDAPTPAPARTYVAQGQNSLGMAFVSEQNGVRRLAISLNNENTLVNAQLDIVLPEGLSVVACSAGERAGQLDLHTNDFGNGVFRVVLASPEFNAIEAGEGALLYLDIEGSASSDITITNAIASDAKAVTYYLDAQDAVATGVNSVSDAVISGVKKVYNMGGQMLDGVKKGVNIILGNDGKAKKVIKK